MQIDEEEYVYQYIKDDNMDDIMKKSKFKEFFSKYRNQKDMDLSMVRQREDIVNRLLGGLGDSIGMFAPSIIFIISGLLFVGYVIDITLMSFIMDILPWLFLFTISFSNILYQMIFHYQSFGKHYYGFKIVDREHKEIDQLTFIKRELLGKALPILITYMILSVYGVFLFIILNYLCIIFDREGRSWIDFILKTKVVRIKQLRILL